MTNSRIIRFMLWVPAVYLFARMVWVFCSYAYTQIYLDIGGLPDEILRGAAELLLIYTVFMRWCMPKFRGIEDGDTLRGMAFRTVTGFAVIGTTVAAVGWLLSDGWQNPESIVAVLGIFVVLWTAGFIYMALVSALLGLRWLAIEAVARTRGYGVSRAI